MALILVSLAEAMIDGLFTTAFTKLVGTTATSINLAALVSLRLGAILGALAHREVLLFIRLVRSVRLVVELRRRWNRNRNLNRRWSRHRSLNLHNRLRTRFDSSKTSLESLDATLQSSSISVERLHTTNKGGELMLVQLTSSTHDTFVREGRDQERTSLGGLDDHLVVNTTSHLSQKLFVKSSMKKGSRSERASGASIGQVLTCHCEPLGKIFPGSREKYWINFLT